LRESDFERFDLVFGRTALYAFPPVGGKSPMCGTSAELIKPMDALSVPKDRRFRLLFTSFFFFFPLCSPSLLVRSFLRCIGSHTLDARFARLGVEIPPHALLSFFLSLSFSPFSITARRMSDSQNLRQVDIELMYNIEAAVIEGTGREAGISKDKETSGEFLVLHTVSLEAEYR